MYSLIEIFHVDIKLLIAQMINFVIVFCILYFLILKPLLKVMENRTKVIEKSLQDAKDIEENLIRAEKDYEKKIIIAKKEANKILERTIEISGEKKKEMVAKAKDEIGQIMENEKANLQSEKAKTLKEIKREVVDLVIISVEKVLDRKLDGKEDKNIIKRMIK